MSGLISHRARPPLAAGRVRRAVEPEPNRERTSTVSKSRTEITIDNYPPTGKPLYLTTKPLDTREAEAIAREARDLGHQATVHTA